MANYDKTKFYWLQLKEDFFEDEAIEWLEEQENGKDYVLFYLKLCLKSLKSDGVLYRTVGTLLVPYDTKKLAELTKTNFDTVVNAMKLLTQIGLVTIYENGTIFMEQVSEMIGSQSVGAFKKQQQLQRKKTGNLLPETTDGGTEVENLPTEYRDKSIDNRDKSIENREIYTAPETDAEPPTPPSRPDKPSAKRFVKPTLEEVEAYCIERNNGIDPQRFIDYYESNGWKVGKNPMKDWKAAIRTWERSEYNDNGGAKNAKHSGNSKEAEPQPSRKFGTYV